MNISFLIPNLYKSQQAFYLTAEINKYRGPHSPLVFVENLAPTHMKPAFPVMQAAEAWQMSGTMIATSPSSTYKMLAFPGPDEKYFYVWDLFWLRGQRRIYEPYMLLFADPGLKVIARSDSHKRAIENAFNIQVAGVVSDFNLDDLISIVDASAAPV